MLTEIAIDEIIIGERIRKEMGEIEDLAKSITEIGLIQPVVIDSDNRLIAGHRRLTAVKSLGWDSVPVRVMTVRDALHKLQAEISENENRKGFTFSEKMEWAAMLEAEYKEVARKNSLAALELGRESSEWANRPTPEKRGRVRDMVAEDIGFSSSRSYERARAVFRNATPELIEQLDAEDISIHAAYQQIQAEKQAAEEALKAQAVEFDKERAATAAKLERQVARASRAEDDAAQARKDAGGDYIDKIDRLQAECRRTYEAKREIESVVKKYQAEASEARRDYEKLSSEFEAYKEQFDEMMAKMCEVESDEQPIVENPLPIIKANSLIGFLHKTVAAFDDYDSQDGWLAEAKREEIDELQDLIEGLKAKVEDLDAAVTLESVASRRKTIGLLRTSLDGEAHPLVL